MSRIGLHTFVDPRQDGGRINDASNDALVELVELAGQELQFYKAFPIDVALLRGTTADTLDNVSMEREALTLDNLAMAMAVRNSGGTVIVQMERIAEAGSLPSRSVTLPKVLVDAVVMAEPGHHWQTYATPFSEAYAHQVRLAVDDLPQMPLTERKVVARRAAFELPVDGGVNLGIGMPEGVASVAAEERVLDRLPLTTEPGVIGGIPASGMDFGAAVNPDAIIDQSQQFDDDDGGGLDLACLGMAELDRLGNVNVSRFGGRLAGAGGFINISPSARTVVFTGTFTAGGLDVAVGDGRLTIRSEGRSRKLRESVQQVTFNGRYAAARGQRVLYITERAVFEASEKGLRPTEVAPGVDVERDVLAQMEFEPLCDGEPARMDPRLLTAGPMGLPAALGL